MYNEIKNFRLVKKEQEILKEASNYNDDAFKAQFDKLFWRRFRAWQDGREAPTELTDQHFLNLLRSKPNFDDESFIQNYKDMALRDLAKFYSTESKAITAAARTFGLSKRSLRGTRESTQERIDKLLPLIREDCNHLTVHQMRKKHKVGHYILTLILETIKNEH